MKRFHIIGYLLVFLIGCQIGEERIKSRVRKALSIIPAVAPDEPHSGLSDAGYPTRSATTPFPKKKR